MRWLLLFLLLAASVSALPTPPGIPSDPFPSAVRLFILAPANNSVVSATSAIGFEHTAPTALNCSLNITEFGVANITVVSRYTQNITLSNGIHEMAVRCANSTTLLTASSSFTVVNATMQNVTIIYPLSTARTSFNITYMHHAPATATCSLSVNGSFIGDKTRTLAPDTQQQEFMTRPEGIYVIGVNCSTGTWNASASTTVNVTNLGPSGGLSIASPVFRTIKVVISGVFGGYEEVKFSIKDPAGNITRLSDISREDGYASVEYPLTNKLGNYTVNGTDEDGKTLNGTFTVITRVPAIKVGHNRTNITSGAAFTVHGWQFMPNDAVTVKLSGTAISEKRFTDSNGEFDFYYGDPLAAKTYTISAQGVSDPQLTASTTLTVLADTTPPITPAVNTTLPVITPTPPPTTTTTGIEDVPKNNDVGAEETPPPLDESPEPIATPASMPWKWILIPLLFFLVIGGTLGYFVYNGTLDVSSFGAFQESVKDLFSGNLTANQRTPTAKPSGNEAATIKSFIAGERGKGFDDLTIRSALLAKGWDKDEVDKIFDQIYKS